MQKIRRRFLLSIFAAAGVTIAPAGDPPDPEDIRQALKVANPEYRGGGDFKLRDGKIVMINLMRCPGLNDLSPLSRFPIDSVTQVVIYNSVNISDLSPLRRCGLKSLNTERCRKITDLSPLKGMPLEYFRMYACAGVEDLSPLRDMPLQHLDIGMNPRIDDLSPLEGMPLTDLRIDHCPEIKDIAVIRGMPLTLLSVFGSGKIGDFSPLLDLPLETLLFSPSLLSEDDIRAVRKSKTLKVLGTGWDDYHKKQTPEQFWARYDKGEFKK